MMRVLLFSLIIVFQFVMSIEGAEVPVWIGMSPPQNGAPEGIYRAVLNDETGGLSQPELVAKIGNPGFLCLNPARTRLYSVCQLDSGEPGVAAFEISQDGTKLELLNTRPIGDGEACHITIDPTGRCLFTAQYGSGSVAVFPLEKDGTIRPRSDLVRHQGSGPNKSRQEAAHPHYVGFDPANRFIFVPDLGADHVVIYRTDLDNGTIKRIGFGKSPSGAGPRHMKFHPDKRWVYVVNELDLSVTAFNYQTGAAPLATTLTPFQTLTTLPKEMQTGADTCSEICLEPSGKFLYAANRGHNSIAVFSINPDNGELTFVEHEDIQGKHPRNFNIDPSGKWLLAAGRDSNTISVFGIDPESGALSFTGTTVSSPAPICIAF